MTQKYEELITKLAQMYIEDGFIFINSDGLIDSTNKPRVKSSYMD